MKIYRGRRAGSDTSTAGEAVFTVTDGDKPVYHLRHVVRHSPTGMNWGYAGSGPADLARSLCVDALGCDVHPAIYQYVKGALLQNLHQEAPWELAEDTVRIAIDRARQAMNVTCVTCVDTGWRTSVRPDACDCAAGRALLVTIDDPPPPAPSDDAA